MGERKKIFVSGCFDLLHSGHIAFIEEASQLGDLYVGLGADKTIYNLKNRRTVYSEKERLYMMKSLKFVKDAWINSGSGSLDFEEDIKKLKPDILFVNEDGDSDSKKLLCEQLGIEYMTSKRIPKDDLPERSTTGIRSTNKIPYRLDLAGGWLDQPYVSKYYPGSVITISIEPEREFNDRSGMSSSTRKKAIEIWGYRIPDDDNLEKLAKLLFSYENPPGKTEISGSQDSIGIVFPGLNKINYKKGYWPDSIETENREEILDWVERYLHFLPLSPRQYDFDVLAGTKINTENAKALADAAENTWDAIMKMDLEAFGKYFTQSFDAQIKMFPNMVNDEVVKTIESVKDKVLGWKLSGAGGGGYLVLVSENKIEGTFQIKIRR
jgi:cytidyltransferase-like protein